MKLTEIEARLAAIPAELEKEGADLDALETEIEQLKEARKTILEAAERRKKMLASVAEGAQGIVTRTFTEDHPQADPEDIRSAAEYRSGWLKRLQGKELNAVEQRSISAASVPGAIPTQTSNMIFSKLVEIAPLLNQITLLRVAGNVSFVVEGDNADAALHTENAEITPAADTTVTVSLAGFEIVKAIRISATVRSMAIDAFESWLTDQLAAKIAYKIEGYIIKGTGSSQPKGVDYSNTWTDGTNAVAWASTAPTYAELCELVGYLKSGYARRASWLMNNKTFWSKIQSIRDDGKALIVQKDGNAYRIMGFPVLLSDFVDDDDMFFGDFKNVVANLAQDITVESSMDSGFLYNAVDYRGVAIFDCDIALPAAFVKGAGTL